MPPGGGTMSIFSIDRHSYKWDTRGSKLERYELRDVSTGQVLVVECPPWIAEQIDMTYGHLGRSGPLKEETAKKYSHGWGFAGEAPDGVEDFLEMLTLVLSIPNPEHVDLTIALDWYYQPDDEDELKRTTAGYWINTTKHASQPTWSNSMNSRRLMIKALVLFINTHPLYRNATAIITAPGHKADGQSFGEVLAREVAAKVGIPFVETTSPGPRAQQKESPQDLTDMFTVQGQLSGDVIVLDDVFHTGGSASGAAAAAKRAGADRVFALTVARTIRR